MVLYSDNPISRDSIDRLNAKAAEMREERMIAYLRHYNKDLLYRDAVTYIRDLSPDAYNELNEHASEWEGTAKEAGREAKAKEKAERERKAQRDHDYEAFMKTVPERYKGADISAFSGDAKKAIVDDGRNVLMLGGNGTGKTYFAIAIAKYFNGQTFKKATYIKAVRLMSDIKAHMGRVDDLFEYIEDTYGKSVDVLIVDEVDKIFASQSDYVYFTHLVDHRYEWKKQIIVIGNCTEEEFIARIGSSPYSRLAGNADGGYLFLATGRDKRFSA